MTTLGDHMSQPSRLRPACGAKTGAAVVSGGARREGRHDRGHRAAVLPGGEAGRADHSYSGHAARRRAQVHPGCAPV